jgi:hypothetical protein
MEAWASQESAEPGWDAFALPESGRSVSVIYNQTLSIAKHQQHGGSSFAFSKS